MDEQFEFVKQIAARLEAADIPYMMTGSMAMAIYSVPRMTRDIDLVIEIKPDVRHLIETVKELDWDYLNNWSKLLGVEQLLTKAKAP